MKNASKDWVKCKFTTDAYHSPTLVQSNCPLSLLVRLVTTRLYRNEAIARCYTGIPVSLSTETTQKHLNINTHHSPGKAAPPTPSRWLPPEHCPRRQYTCPLGWKSGGCHCSVAPGLPMKHIALLNRYYKKLTINKNTLY